MSINAATSASLPSAERGTFLCQLVEETPLPRLRPGELTVHRFRLRNVGTAVWQRGGRHQVLLGTDAPLDRASDLYLPQHWVRDNRPTRLFEAAVPPGAVGTFQTVIRAASLPGRHVEPVRPLAEGLSWFDQIDLRIEIEVVLPTVGDDWTLGYEVDEPIAPLLLRVGQVGAARIRVRNTSRVRWTDRGAGHGPLVLLGTDEPRDHPGTFFVPDRWFSPNRPTGVRGFVLPGETTELVVPVVAPARPGTYQESYRLVAEGFGWLPGRPIRLRVVAV